MKHLKYTCDKCGKEMLPTYSYLNHVKLVLRYWHGGSMGGSEDNENFDIDICEECAISLSGLLKKWICENDKKC